MDTFSVYNYQNLSDAQKTEFRKSLANRLTALVDDIANDEVLGTLAIGILESLQGTAVNADDLVVEVYSHVTGGVQAGTGNQFLYNNVLSAFVDSWVEIQKK